MILREVRLLRRDFEIHTASIRAPDRPLQQLSKEEREEANQTFYVKPRGAFGGILGLLVTLFTQPAGFFCGFSRAISLAKGRPKQTLLNLAYFAQAAIVGRWMRRLNLTHLHTHYSSTVALLVHETFGIDISISFHGPDEFNDPTGFWIREKVAACTFVRAISHYARSQLMRASATEHWEKIHVVYMGVDPEAFTPRPFRENPSPIEMICVGRLAPVKAQHILIGVVEKLVHENFRVLLHLVGGGPDRASLDAEVAARGLGDAVMIHGFTPQDKLETLYRRADIFALPSFAEGVPGVLMEAMAMEIPCVSTWITGTPELIRNGVDGLLAAPSDVEGFAEAIRSLIVDSGLRRNIGEAGRARILDRFDLRKNSAALGELFEGS